MSIIDNYLAIKKNFKLIENDDKLVITKDNNCYRQVNNEGLYSNVIIIGHHYTRYVCKEECYMYTKDYECKLKIFNKYYCK